MPTRPQEQTSRGLGPEPDVDVQLVAHNPKNGNVIDADLATYRLILQTLKHFGIYLISIGQKYELFFIVSKSQKSFLVNEIQYPLVL